LFSILLNFGMSPEAKRYYNHFFCPWHHKG
jgi:hypothetical protein